MDKKSNSVERRLAGNRKGAAVRVAQFKLDRENAYEVARHANLSHLDVLMTGLYWGEGAKSTSLWYLINADPEIIRAGVRWLKCHGFIEMRAMVHYYDDCDIPEPEIRKFWAATGIPSDKINFYKKTAKVKQSKRPKLKFGTCYLAPKNSARAFETYRGQKDQLMAKADK